MKTGGKLISIEGGDGTGKSTQSAILAQRLRGLGFDVVETREPGGTPGAERIRSLILDGDVELWSPISELLLFSAARRDHCERVIFPSLERGAIVVSDRFHDSTAVYQMAAHGADPALFSEIHRRTIGLTPVRTVVLLLDPSVARERRDRRSHDRTRFERRGVEFDSAVDRAFRDLCQRETDRCKAVDAAFDPAQVADAVWEAVRDEFVGVQV